MSKGADARERLVEAAQQLYAVKGVAATPPRDVLERSGVGQGSLYHHFPRKQDLARSAVERTVEEQLGSARRALGGVGTPEERVGEYLLHDRDAVAGCRVGRLTADPLVMSEPNLRELVEGYFVDVVGLVREVFEGSGMSAESARERAATVVAVVQGGYVLARATGDPGMMRSAVRGLFSLLQGDAGAEALAAGAEAGTVAAAGDADSRAGARDAPGRSGAPGREHARDAYLGRSGEVGVSRSRDVASSADGRGEVDA